MGEKTSLFESKANFPSVYSIAIVPYDADADWRVSPESIKPKLRKMISNRISGLDSFVVVGGCWCDEVATAPPIEKSDFLV